MLRFVFLKNFIVKFCLYFLTKVFDILLRLHNKMAGPEEPVMDGPVSNSEASRRLLGNVITNDPKMEGTQGLSLGRQNLRKWLGKAFRVEITDGRILIGYFNCTDRDANLVLTMCAEYLEDEKDARILGNVMIPGKHIVSISVDMPEKDAFASPTSAIPKEEKPNSE